MRTKLFLFSALALSLAGAAHADQKLADAISQARLKWDNYHFVAHEINRSDDPTEKFRYQELTVEGDMVKNEQKRRSWHYKITPSEDYVWPQPGELGAPLGGEWITRPGGPTEGVGDNSYHKRPGESEWRKVRGVTWTFAATLESRWLLHALTQNYESYNHAQLIGTFPIFGAPQVQGKRCVLYRVASNDPRGYEYSYWLDPQNGQLVQLSLLYKEPGRKHSVEILMVFLNPNAPGLLPPAVPTTRKDD